MPVAASAARDTGPAARPGCIVTPDRHLWQSRAMDRLPNLRHFRGRSVALLTKHGKAGVIAPALAALDLTVVHTEDFDTDTLGTFSGEVERTLSPLECARTKAKLACTLTGLEIGLGSEGSFGGGPMPGLLNWDSELLVLHHAGMNYEIVAAAAGPVRLAPVNIASLDALEQSFSGSDPGQGWILRAGQRVIKGLEGAPAIAARLRALSQVDRAGRLINPVTIEPDLRAMHCPQRRAYIRQAAEQLAARLQSGCPACDAPDFWPDATEPGLPCADCGAPTRLPLAHVRRCRVCRHTVREPAAHPFADPGKCDWCNP